jgi:hypothetical protein
MEVLDGDAGALVSSNNERAARDVCQFVPFNKFKTNPVMLAENVLGELPDQLVKYKMLVGQPPAPPPKVDMTKIN